MQQQKQIFGFRKSKLTKNLTGAVLGAALLASVGVAQADTPTEGHQPDRITEKTKTVMKIDDWSNVYALKGSKYDRVTTTPRATSTIQIGTSGTDPLPKNSYIKVIQEATGVHTNLVNTAVSIEDKGVTSTTTPTERNGNNSTSAITVDISGMPPGEIKTLTAAFQEMQGFYPASTLKRTYELWVDGKKVDTQTFDTHFSSVKPQLTVEASDSDTDYSQGKLDGSITNNTVGSHELNISTLTSRPVTLKIQVPEGSVPIGYRIKSSLGMPARFEPFKNGDNGVTFKDGILTIPNYLATRGKLPIFSPSAETLKNPIPTTGDNVIGSKKVQFRVTMIVPEDIQGTTTSTAEATAEATERTRNKKPSVGQVTIIDHTSPFGTETGPTNVRTFTELEHTADQRLLAYDDATTMDIHPVLLRLDETNTLDTKNLGMKFAMRVDRLKAPLHFEVRDHDTNKVLIADYVIDQAGRKGSSVDIPYTKNLLITPKANADGTLPQLYGDSTQGPEVISYETTVTGLDPNIYRARVDANAGTPIRITNVSHLRDTKDPTKAPLKASSDTFVSYSHVKVGSSSAADVVYIGKGAKPSEIKKLGDQPGSVTTAMTGWTMDPKIQLTVDSTVQLREAIQTLPENQQPRVRFNLPDGFHLVTNNRFAWTLLDGDTATVDQFMKGLKLVADKDVPAGTYEAPYTIDFSHLPNLEDYTFEGAEKGSAVLKGSLKLTLYDGDKISTTSEVKVGSTWRPYKLDVQKDAPFTIRSNVRIGQKVSSQLNTLVYIPKKGRDKTTIDTFLTGPVGYGDNNGTIPKDSRWAIEYTTDPITGDRVADNKKLHFTKTVDDYSKVTAVRFVLEAPMPLVSSNGFNLQKLNFPLVTHDEITPTSVAYYRTSLVDSEHSYDSDFVALAGPNFVDHDKVLANSKGSVRQLFKEEGTNKELAPQTDTGMRPVGEALSLTHPKTIQFEGKTYEFTRQDKVDPTKIPDAFRETITYFYKEVQPKGNVVQKFVDEAGKEIKASTDTGVKPVDEAIKLEHPTTIHFEDNDYTFMKQDKVDPTKIVEGTQTITYIYRKVEKPVVKGNIVQKFVDEAGKEIKASTDTGVKPVDEAIKLEHPTTIHFEDNDYTFVKQDKVDPTKIIEGTQTITYIYKKVEKPVVKGNVVQKFVDEAGKEIKASTDTGVKPVDEAIKLEHPTTIHFEDNDYTFVKQDKVDPTKIVEGTQIVTYIYRKVEKPIVKGNVVQKFVDEAGKEIKASTDTGVKPVDEAIKLEHPTTIHFEDNDYSFVKQDKVDPTKIVEGTQTVTYIYRKVEKPVKKVTTIWVTEKGEVLKPRTDGEQPKENFDGYEFVRTDKDKDGNTTHIYRPIEKPVKKVTTIWVTEKGEVLKPRTDGEQPKENFDGYEFVRTDKDKDGNTTHIYRPVEKPVKKVTTIWVTEKGEVLKPRTDGEQPKENFDGYEFVRTDKDKDGNITHIYRPIKKVTTIWVTEKGDVLKPRTDGEQPKENFDGYEFVRTDKDNDGNTTHIYRPVEKPVEKPVKKVTTIWVTEKGDVLKPRTDGEQPKENFDGYEFVRTDKDKDGNTTHIYRPIEKPVKKVTTIWVTEKGEVLKPRTDGEQPKEHFDGYEFVRTDKDEDGNTNHIYRKVEKPVEKPVKKVTTIWVTETGEVLKPRIDGEQPKLDFDGYEFVRTDKDEDGNVSHIYKKVGKPVEKPVKKVYTSWVTETGEVLKPRTEGEQPKENFDGYEFVRTDKDRDGNTNHIYRKVEKPVEKPQPAPQPQKVETPKELPKSDTPKELPKTGDASTSLGLVSIALLAAGLLAKPRKRRN